MKKTGKIKIGVVGPGTCTASERKLGYAVGSEIAKCGAMLVCGGLGGVMAAAAGLNTLEASMLSMMVNAGGAQIASLQAWAASRSLSAASWARPVVQPVPRKLTCVARASGSMY